MRWLWSKIAVVWSVLRRPSAQFSLLTLLVVGFVAGILFWGGFHTAMEASNTLPFCISCHEMRDNIYKEYVGTIHNQNRTGVQATCADCHVPRDWMHKVMRKIQATNELFHWAVGSVDTPEKFDAKRLHLASNVWRSMKATDSRECRNCHTIESMNPEFQRPRARKSHMDAMGAGNTCIDCHKGIAHKNVRSQVPDRDLEELEKPLAAYARQIPPSYREGIKRAEQREEEIAARRKAEVDSEAQRIASELVARQRAAAAPAPTAAPAAPATAAAPDASTTPAAPAAAAPAAAGPGSGIDWSAVEAKTVTLFYPGQASFEWIQNTRDHGGARAFLRAGDRCSECHVKEVKDMGAKLVSGQKAEATPIPGKRPFVDLAVQAAHDGDTLYFRFQWRDGPHNPVPFVSGGKMDAENKVKLAVMIAGNGIERAEQAGCWVTCHHDSRYMPDAPKADVLSASPLAQTLDLRDGITKYLAETRTQVEIRGDDGKPRGGGLNLKSPDAIAELAKKGAFTELLRFRSGQPAENGHVLEQRVNQGGASVQTQASLDGDMWTLVLSRPLKSDRPGDISIEPGKVYTVNFALHDDFTAARFHHVSLEQRFGVDAKEAEINAVKR
ncbi:MAG: NapC/NirT family cytochrome c [Hyphomicrobiales bacterium]|nr:NapC/NirT family cytochrome c [Hyphomicrobiales bacterium]